MDILRFASDRGTPELSCISSKIVQFPDDHVREPQDVPPLLDWCSLSVLRAKQVLFSRRRQSSIHWWYPGPDLHDMNEEAALQFLSSSNPHARKFAVFRLGSSLDDGDLELYLLQLVQALRFEDAEVVREGLHRDLREFCEGDGAKKRRRSKEEVRHGNKSCPDLIAAATAFHPVDMPDASLASEIERYNSVTEMNPLLPPASPPLPLHRRCLPPNGVNPLEERMYPEIALDLDLSAFLVHRCCQTFRLANYFYWYLMAECEPSSHNCLAVQEMYLIVLKRFLLKLEHGCAEWNGRFQVLQRQHLFVQHLIHTVGEVQSQSGSRPKKLRFLKERLVLPNAEIGSFADFRPIPLPLDPEITIDGIVPGRCEIFKSATLPCKFVFRQSCSNDLYTVIFKTGNDLRQDQFAQQMINLFDRIFRDCGLDLKLTPYKVLATSSNSGFVEFIESRSVADVNSEFGSILKYFNSLSGRKKNLKSIVGNFSKSCAAYCVVTYLLGVGDRHLDNLLLTKDGQLFHVDFAFLFGQDPKPLLPPPMKLTKEMIEAMGGSQSVGYQQFRQHCHTAYLVLRRNSDLILSLLSLMSGSSTPAFRRMPGAAADGVRERLKLDLADREAVKHIDHLLHLSSSALVASLVERLHKLAQAMRT